MANPAPTYSEVWTAITQLCKIFTILYRNATSGSLYSTAGNNITGQVDTLLQALEGVYIDYVSRAVLDLLLRYDDLFSVVKTAMDGSLLEMGRVIKANSEVPDVILDYLYTYMRVNSDTVKYRNITFGSATAGVGNIGNGTILRHTTDRYGNSIENTTEGILTIKCVGDRYTATNRHEENWSIYGEHASPNNLENPRKVGSGNVGATAGPSLSLLSNPSFEDDGASISGSLTGWTIGSGGTSNISISTTVAFNGTYSLKFTASDYIQQTVAQKFDTEVPYAMIVHWHRNSSGTGTLTASLGSQSSNVVVAAQTGWNRLSLTKFYEQFKQASVVAKVDWARTGGDFFIDSVILIPMIPTNVDGTFVLPTPCDDSNGGWLEGDVYTFTDSSADTGVIQFVIHYLYGKYLPHTSGSPTITEPTF